LSPLSRLSPNAWLIIAAVALALGLVYLLGPVLVPFVTALVIAYALHPVVEALARRKFGSLRLPRALCVAVVIIVFAIVAAGVVLLVVPVITKELPLLKDQLPALLERLASWAQPLLHNLGIPLKLDIASLKKLLGEALSANAQDVGQALLSSVRIGGGALLTVIGNLVLIPVVLFYVLMDWANLMSRAQSLLPPKLKASVMDFWHECDRTLAQYLRGQLLVMAVLALYYAVGLSLARFDLALPIGLFTGLAIFVPYVGFGIGLLLALTAGLLQFAPPYALASVAMVYGIGQVLEGFFLTPRLVGERIGLHPLAVIFALLAFGQLFGFVGVLVALPASAVALVALRRAVSRYQHSALFKG
jgi:predicted PurR-regulated permease PerM